MEYLIAARDSIFGYFNSDPLAFLSFVIGPISLLVSIFIYFASIKVKRPTYAIRTSKLISDFRSDFAHLQVLYQNKPVESFTVSKIAFWNDGKETIAGTDIAAHDPLQVCIADPYIILDASILAANKPANKFSVSTAGNKTVGLSFDYVDHQQGAVIQIIHDGKSTNDITLKGTIKGAGTLRRKHRSHRLAALIRAYMKRTRRKLMGVLLIVCSAFILTTAVVFSPPQVSQPTAHSHLTWIIANALAALLYIGMGLLLLRRVVPRGLEVFES